MPARSDMGPGPGGRSHGGHGSANGLPKYHAISTVAEALDISPRTVRRWIKNGDLIATRVRGVVRIADNDLRAFLAVHREG